MQAAMHATEEPKERTYFGEVVTVDAWFAILRKGVGKVAFDQTQHDIADRRTVIKLEIDPLKGDFLIMQETLHFEDEWLKFTLPSLQKLGIDLAALKGKWVQLKRVPTGRTYQNKSNETKDRTAIVFEKVFAASHECAQAADVFFAGRGQRGKVEAADLPSDLGLPPEQAFALRSLPALWKASGNDAEKFKTLIDQNPLISKHYPWSHPHVQGLVSGGVDDLFTDTGEVIPF
jgi:hypothetical protein